MKLANEIVELFEELLDEKGIEIPCDDETEQKDRYDGGNGAKLYGMEYWNLVEAIEDLLNNTSCTLWTSMGGADAKLSINENGELVVTSERLDNYLEEYSME